MVNVYIALILISLGLIASVGSFLVLRQLIRKCIKKFFVNKSYVVKELFTDAATMLSVLYSIGVLILFGLMSFGMLNQTLLAQLQARVVNLLMSLLVIAIIIFCTYLIMKVISLIVKRLRIRYSEIIAIFLQIMIGFASLLTILEYTGINATPFLEIFRVILYTIGLTVAIAAGLAIGLSIQKKVEHHLNKKK